MTYPFWKTWWKLSGWSFDGAIPGDVKKAVVIAGPYTSWKDLVVGSATVYALKLRQVKFMGNKDLYKKPLCWFLRSSGAKSHFKTNTIVRKAIRSFADNKEFMLAVSPEGTRKKVNRLDTAFYFIAKKANVPVIMIGLDYGSKKVIISDPFYTTEDKEEDFNRIHSFFSSIKGHRPEKGLQHFKATSGIIYSFKRSFSH